MFRKSPKHTPPPSREQKLENENWKLKEENDRLKDRLAFYNDAVRSIVLRLKVLDVDQLKKEMGEDGTIPMRMALKELTNLIELYDDKVRDFWATSSPTYSPSPQY